MGELLDTRRLAEIGDAFLEWLLANVFVLTNAVQLAVIMVAFGVSLVVARRVSVRPPAQPALAALFAVARPLALALIWLALLWLALLAAGAAGWPRQLLQIGASLVTAWVVIRLVSQAAPSPTWAKLITWVVWSVAALSILRLLEPTIVMLDSAALDFTPRLRISLYSVIKSALALAVLLAIARYVTRLFETRVRASRTLSASAQVLFTKLFRATLVAVAIVIGIHSLGIDLTAIAVLLSALGLGAGFGLQKVISNMVSGVVLLIDQSIRPGDVISVSGTYGWVTSLGGRYVSVVTRDGVEHLIPNETLISERVENWTHTNSHTRLKIPVRVAYDTDVHRAIDMCVQAACQTPRVLAEPECRCLLVAFGDNGLELEVRIWIGDAHNGVQNVKSAVLLRIWDLFREAGIRVPPPQRDITLRGTAAEGLSSPPT
ncbi:MAG TPA: mechanosensitive ion channel domain-containing protein [Gammaproteobacteria bacterium]|nr:mechanosensitive ion channel domain-containing protein [Gammaproteobacteria bacterium]